MNKEFIFYMVMIGLAIALIWNEGKPKQSYVWIENCQYLKIEEGFSDNKTINYIPTNNCNK